MHLVAGSVPRAIASGSHWGRDTPVVECARYLPRSAFVQRTSVRWPGSLSLAVLTFVSGLCLAGRVRHVAVHLVTGSVPRAIASGSHWRRDTPVVECARYLRRGAFVQRTSVRWPGSLPLAVLTRAVSVLSTLGDRTPRPSPFPRFHIVRFDSSRKSSRRSTLRFPSESDAR